MIEDLLREVEEKIRQDQHQDTMQRMIQMVESLWGTQPPPDSDVNEILSLLRIIQFRHHSLAYIYKGRTI